MKTFYPDAAVAASPGVYAPQHDSMLLVEAMRRSVDVDGRSVLDLCTGSGIAAISAAQGGAGRVTAIDICRRAVRCTRRNARAAGVRITARVGTLSDGLASGPHDVVVCNPPYVPTQPGDPGRTTREHGGPCRAWNAGPDGRMVLDPLCDAAADLLGESGVLLIVQSEFADPHRTIRMLNGRGLDTEIVAAKRIPFGPVLNSRIGWMESTGLLRRGRRAEDLVVIRGSKR